MVKNRTSEERNRAPIATAPMVIRNPKPYPNVIPATHMDGVEGKSIDGNIAKEPTTVSASIIVLNVFLSQISTGMIS